MNFTLDPDSNKLFTHTNTHTHMSSWKPNTERVFGILVVKGDFKKSSYLLKIYTKIFMNEK